MFGNHNTAAMLYRSASCGGPHAKSPVQALQRPHEQGLLYASKSYSRM
jgi:hypothetical protein